MIDPRVKKLAEILVNYSVKVERGSVIQINFGVEAAPLALEVYKLVLEKGGLPNINPIVQGFAYQYYKLATNEQLKHFPKSAMFRAERADGVISIGADYNTKEFTNISPKKIALRRRVIDPISKLTLSKDNWVGCQYPTNAIAQDADLSLEEIEDFVFKATNVDWEAMSKKQDKIKKILDEGSKVRIKSANTDISFSIEGRQGIKCDGHRNMPDGEVFIAPVEESVEGFIEYSYPAIYGGREVNGIKLEFKKGMVVKSSAKKNEEFLKEMINTDEGSKFIGEFGIGLNYGIKKFIKQILFDEKIGGTIHLALGMAYKEGGGKNESALHWDMVKDLRDGGEFWIDDKKIQKDGKFLI